MKRILVTTDLSEESFRPLLPICDLARVTKASIVLFHAIVVPPLVTGGVPAPAVLPTETEEIEQRARSRLDAILATLPDDVQVDVKSERASDCVQAILECAKRERADVIAIATHGRAGLRRAILGSVAESIARNSTVPVMLYPPVA